MQASLSFISSDHSVFLLTPHIHTAAFMWQFSIDANMTTFICVYLSPTLLVMFELMDRL